MAGRDGKCSDNNACRVAFGRTGQKVLVVSATDMLPAHVTTMHLGRIVHLPYATLSATVVRMIAPDLVIAPLFCGAFDALDLMAMLRDAGFAGALTVLSDRLPDPRAVEAEIRKTANKFNVTLIQKPLPTPR